MNVRRRSGQMSGPMGSPIKNAVTQRKDSPTTPKAIMNQAAPCKPAEYSKVKNAISDCRY